MPGKPKDITGKRFGRLLAQRIEGRRSSSSEIYWSCLCDCGETKAVRVSSLRRGKTKSCGCLQRECRARVGKPVLEHAQAASCIFCGGKGCNYCLPRIGTGTSARRDPPTYDPASTEHRPLATPPRPSNGPWDETELAAIEAFEREHGVHRVEQGQWEDAGRLSVYRRSFLSPAARAKRGEVRARG